MYLFLLSSGEIAQLFSPREDKNQVCILTPPHSIRGSAKLQACRAPPAPPGKGISFPIESVLFMPYRIMFPLPSLYTQVLIA